MNTAMISPLPSPASDLSLEVDNFPINGCAHFGQILDPAPCSQLRDHINEQRPIQPDIFYPNEAEFKKNGRWERYAPGPGHNFLEGIDLSFIEDNPTFKNMAEKVLGPNYSIMKKAIIRSVPEKYIPEWLFSQIGNVGRPNLNPFIYDHLQDVQYFYCTDYHQDKTRPESEFVTFYVYLDEVDRAYSALRLLRGTHVSGMTTYPHSLRRSNIDHNLWFYTDQSGKTVQGHESDVTGPAGSVACFHGLTLHGTPINVSDNPRISIRYLLSPDPNFKNESLLTQANSRIFGQQSIAMPRCDIADDGSYLPIGSSLASYE